MAAVITLTDSLLDRYKKDKEQFYIREIIDTYAHAADPAVRIKALKLLKKVENDSHSKQIVRELVESE